MGVHRRGSDDKSGEKYLRKRKQTSYFEGGDLLEKRESLTSSKKAWLAIQFI